MGGCLVNGMLQSAIVYQMRPVAHTNYSGKFAVMTPLVLAFSGAIGPGITAAVIESSGFTPV
jgi:hypothetical protein